MAALTDFFPAVTTDIVGCPSPVLEAAVRKAAITFCEDTLSLISTLTTFQSVDGVNTYTLTPPTDHEIYTLLSVRYDDNLLPPVNRLEAHQSWTEPEYPAAFWFERPASLRLWGPADKVADIVVTAALKPAFTATTVDDILRTDWEDEIAAYAKYLLARQPGKPWSNADFAAYAFDFYHRGVAKARRLEYSGKANAPIMVAMRPLA